MKEVTYEDWQKNPTPRMMWVWDNHEDCKHQVKVIYLLKAGQCEYPVVTIKDEYAYEVYKHCAEIEKQRLMTNKELSRWLREKPTREWKYQTSDFICSTFDYRECMQDEEVYDDIFIREDDGEWREPLVEVEE